MAASNNSRFLTIINGVCTRHIVLEEVDDIARQDLRNFIVADLGDIQILVVDQFAELNDVFKILFADIVDGDLHEGNYTSASEPDMAMNSLIC